METTLLSHSSAQRNKEAATADQIDLFRLFAQCFGQPSRECFAWLSGEDSRNLWNQFGRHLGVAVKLIRADSFSDYSSYEAAYLALFEIGVPQPPVPLLESAHSKRAVPQEIVLECVNFYDVLGLRPSGSIFPADHLVTQLEFLAAVRYVREHQSDSQKAEPLRRLEREFVERHLLNWLPVVQEKIDRLNAPLFPVLLRLLTAHLRAEASLLVPQEKVC
jgi:TorA maturation chaperone TorD